MTNMIANHGTCKTAAEMMDEAWRRVDAGEDAVKVSNSLPRGLAIDFLNEVEADRRAKAIARQRPVELPGDTPCTPIEEHATTILMADALKRIEAGEDPADVLDEADPDTSAAVLRELARRSRPQPQKPAVQELPAVMKKAQPGVGLEARMAQQRAARQSQQAAADAVNEAIGSQEETIGYEQDVKAMEAALLATIEGFDYSPFEAKWHLGGMCQSAFALVNVSRRQCGDLASELRAAMQGDEVWHGDIDEQTGRRRKGAPTEEVTNSKIEGLVWRLERAEAQERRARVRFDASQRAYETVVGSRWTPRTDGQKPTEKARATKASLEARVSAALARWQSKMPA